MIPSFLINHILTFVQLAHVLYMLLMALLFWKKKNRQLLLQVHLQNCFHQNPTESKKLLSKSLNQKNWK